MNTTQRPTTGHRRGANRPLTRDEQQHLKLISPALGITGARTAKNADARDRAHRALIELFEDGVSIADLANATNRTTGGVNQHLMTARRLGFGTGQRRYIPRPKRTPASRIRATRDLTQIERTALQDAYQALPDVPGAGRDWHTPQGEDLLDLIRKILSTKPRTPQSEIAAAVGVSRQALNQRLQQPPTIAA